MIINLQFPYSGQGNRLGNVVRFGGQSFVSYDRYLYDVRMGRRSTLAEYDNYLDTVYPKLTPMQTIVKVAKEPKFLIFKITCYLLALLVLFLLASSPISNLLLAILSMEVGFLTSYIKPFAQYLYKKDILKC